MLFSGCANFLSCDKRGIVSGKTNQRKRLRGLRNLRQEKGASVFEIYIISYNAGYTKYRGVKKPSFPGFGPFRRLLSLLGWLDRFFAFGTVMLFIAILLICFLRSFIIIVQSLAESFPALMSSTSPLDSDAAYSQRVFLFPNRRNRSYNTITMSVHWA